MVNYEIKTMKTIALVFGSLLIFSMCLSPEQEAALKQERHIEDSIGRFRRAAQKIIDDSLYGVRIKEEIASIKKFSGKSYEGSIQTLQLELALFKTWASMAEKGLKIDNKQTQKQAKILKSRLSSLQIREFPILRRKYSKVAKNLMWEHDITVSCVGKGSRILSFTGGTFAANKNKQDFQKKIKDVLKQFRFKQTRYRWFKGQDEYTYYEIKHKKDSEI